MTSAPPCEPGRDVVSASTGRGVTGFAWDSKRPNYLFVVRRRALGAAPMLPIAPVMAGIKIGPPFARESRRGPLRWNVNLRVRA